MMRTGIVAGAVLAGLLLATGPALAVQPGPSQIDFTTGTFGLALGQVARINAVNVTGQPGPIGCQVELNFRDADGVPVYPLPQVNQLAAGHSAFLDLPFDVLPTGGNRVMVRADVRASCEGQPGPQQSPAVLLTIEVFDAATGRASAMINPGPSQ
jgi:hypothetical protein